VVRLCDGPGSFEFAYDVDLSIKEKIEAIARKIYRADSVTILPYAMKEIERLEKLSLDKVPICMAKTQYSFSDNPSLLGAPKNWNLTVRNIKISSGAGFIVAFTGDIMTMPGLPPTPSAEKIDIDNSGKISGLF
jgi:formate--tetrahydrofolate ligase